MKKDSDRSASDVLNLEPAFLARISNDPHSFLHQVFQLPGLLPHLVLKPCHSLFLLSRERNHQKFWREKESGERVDRGVGVGYFIGGITAALLLEEELLLLCGGCARVF